VTPFLTPPLLTLRTASNGPRNPWPCGRGLSPSVCSVDAFNSFIWFSVNVMLRFWLFFLRLSAWILRFLFRIHFISVVFLLCSPWSADTAPSPGGGSMQSAFKDKAIHTSDSHTTPARRPAAGRLGVRGHSRQGVALPGPILDNHCDNQLASFHPHQSRSCKLSLTCGLPKQIVYIGSLPPGKKPSV